MSNKRRKPFRSPRHNTVESASTIFSYLAVQAKMEKETERMESKFGTRIKDSQGILTAWVGK